MSAAPCRFFQQGRCNAGRSCKFSHNPSVLKQSIAVPPCRYFAAGHCAAGDACTFAHVTKEKKKGPAPAAESLVRSRELPVGYAVPSKSMIKEQMWTPHQNSLGACEEDLTYSMETLTTGDDEMEIRVRPSYAAQALKNAPQSGHAPAAAAAAAAAAAVRSSGARSDEELVYLARVREQVAMSAEKECGICLEPVSKKGEQFGLLDGCVHVFCLTCIREWRSVNDLGKEVKRSCPLCREVSHLVIPSSFVPDSDESKQQVVATYRARLAQIHCKHFRSGDGECPFGTSCMYKHQYRDGTMQRYEPPRLRMNDEGELQAVGRVTLFDLIQEPAR